MRKFLSLLFILCGLLLAGYPWISNYINERAADGEIQVYEDEVDDLDAEKVEQYLSDAREYNRLLVETKLALIDPFDQTLSDTYSDTPYKYLLDYNGQGIMGFVEIPCINVKLPIYHGTTSEVLEKGVGHQEGSSLPIGGESTHAVLTGHTGLNKAKLFTDLTQVEVGDLFFISVLNEKLAYKVDEINVVLPEDTSKLQIIDGEDHVTLVTCTPYGVNDHRLLVRGTRTAYVESEYDDEQKKDNTEGSVWMEAYKKAFIIGLIATAVIILVILLVRKFKEKKGGTQT